MPPKRKAFAELSRNVSQRGDVQTSNSLSKRQRRSAKSTTGKINPVGGGVREDGIRTGESSQTAAGGKSVLNGRSVIGGRVRVDAKTLPELPPFQPFHSECPEHSAKVNLPEGCGNDPFSLFSLFFTSEMFEELAVNTNLYASMKRGMVASGKGSWQEARKSVLKEQDMGSRQREWRETTAPELRVWFGLIIKIGLHQEPALPLHWNKRARAGLRQISKKPLLQHRWLTQHRTYRIPKSCMSLNRFQQIKRYFHVSDPRIELTAKDWYYKLEPLASQLQERFQQFYIPSTKVAIDEMMIRFCGRSAHTVKMKNKPIKQGYKVFALCSHGYTYAFLWYSLLHSTANLIKLDHLTPTASAVYQLARMLPEEHCWNLVLDNYFTSIPLFEELGKIGIGASGTTRVDARGFPSCLKIEKSEARKALPWGHLSGAVVANTCCLVWQDNNSVLFMTSYHDITATVNRLRRRPKKTSTNGATIRQIFGDDSRKLLPIPVFIDDYNQHMGGVDIADQLRSYYSTQLKACRNWLPLFFWLLDTTIINSYRIRKTLFPNRKGRSHHYLFREDLADKLIEHGLYTIRNTDRSSSEPTAPPAPHTESERSNSYACQNRPPPRPISFPPPHSHHYEQRPTRSKCLWCRWKRVTDKGIKIKSIYLGCRECNYALCRDCFVEFHGITSAN